MTDTTAQSTAYTLDACINAAWSMAKRTIETKGHINFCAILHDSVNHKVGYMPPVGLTKQDFADVLPLAVKEFDADIVLIICEAWIATRKNGETFPADVAVSDLPDRVEAVAVSWATADGQRGTQVANIVRGEGGSVTIAESNFKSTDSMNRFLDFAFGKPTLN